MNDFTMNCGVVCQTEPVSLQEKEFHPESVRTSLYKLFQVVDIIKVENLSAATNTKSEPNNVSCVSQRQGAKECAFRHLEAVQDVIKRWMVTLLEPYSC